MTDAQKLFLDLAKQLEAKQKEVNDLREHLDAAMKQLQMAGHTALQDPETGAVYKVIKPKGTFTYFKDVDYVRTALGDERAGSLSKKEAESLGFQLLSK